MIEASEREADIACFVVHEFESSHTKATNLARNAKDLQAFVATLAGRPDIELPDGQLVGPFLVPGASSLPLYLGKVRTKLTDSAATEEVVLEVGNEGGSMCDEEPR